MPEYQWLGPTGVLVGLVSRGSSEDFRDLAYCARNMPRAFAVPYVCLGVVLGRTGVFEGHVLWTWAFVVLLPVGFAWSILRPIVVVGREEVLVRNLLRSVKMNKHELVRLECGRAIWLPEPMLVLVTRHRRIRILAVPLSKAESLARSIAPHLWEQSVDQL